MNADPVLVTGCSSGIGKATARALVAAGHTVYATARRPETLALDVTAEESRTAAVAAVEAEHGAVGTLVNNAGYGVYGPVEEVAMDDVRREFETNVFGLGRMTQLVLPGMRAAGRGRIVNISSMGGRLVYPTGGWYHASKYAVEAMSDALRVEVRPFGMRATADDVMRRGYSSRAGAEPAAVADVIRRAVEASRPRSRYVVTPAAKAQVQLRRLGGDRLWDSFVGRAYGIR
jgi:NADP-dependent 3-hydroxy acid dehydrogenase YdfG